MSLVEENERLKLWLEQKEQDVILAGKYGCELLESNTALSNQLDDLTKSYSATIKDLKQENYALAQKLLVKSKTEQSQSNEIEKLEKKLQSSKSDSEVAQDQLKSNKKTVEKLQNKVDELEKDIENMTLKNTCLADDLKVKEFHLDEIRASTVRMSNDKSDETLTDLADLHARCSDLLTEKQSLDSALSSNTAEMEKLKLCLERETAHRLQLEQELEEKECQASSYINTIEKTRQEKLELQVEMDAMKMLECDPNKQGNSLFAEVEDNRVKLQNQLINLRVSHDTLKKRNEVYHQQIAKMKHQMIGLLSMSGSKVDSEYVRQLNNSLTQARAEVQELTAKLAKIQSDCNGVASSFKCTTIGDGSSVPASAETHEYIKLMLTKSRKECEELKKELQSVRFMKTAETDALLKSEQKLYVAERNANNYKTEALKLKLKIDELTSKNKDPKKVINQRKEMLPGFEPSPPPEILHELNVNESDQIKTLSSKVDSELMNDDKKKKKSVRISDHVVEQDSDIEKENEVFSKTHAETGAVASTGHVANVKKMDYKDATIQCPQQ